MHDGNTVQLQTQKQVAFERFGMRITTYIRRNGRTGYKLHDKMSGKLLARSGNFQKVYSHAQTLSERRAG